MQDPHLLTPEQRFQEIAAIFATAILRRHVRSISVQENPADSSEVSLDDGDGSSLTVRDV